MLTAAKLVAESAGIDRFRSRAAFARWNGTAPIPVWTGNERFRLSRSGNRQANAAIHRIAICQWRDGGRGHDYVARRIEEGDTKRSAIRALKRRISDEVFRRLHDDLAQRHQIVVVSPAAQEGRLDIGACAWLLAPQRCLSGVRRSD